MRKFHSAHTWVVLDGEEATIGLTFYAQAHLGEIVYVDLPPAGTEIRMGQPLGGIESAKTTSEVVAPISGSVVASNQELESQPGLINDSPLDQGWITRIRPTEPGEVEDLMDSESYESFLLSQEQVN